MRRNGLLNFRFSNYVWLLVILLCILLFLPFYPGAYDNSDPADIWKAAIGLEPLYNWHAPFFQLFWRFIGVFGGLFLFNLLCYWIGLALTSYALFDSLYARLLFLLLIGFFPTNLYFIIFIRADMISFSTLILSFAFFLLYLFRSKKTSFLWLALLFAFIGIGVKQNVIAFSALLILVTTYLLLKHHVRFFKMPTFHYKKKSHVIFIFLLLIVTMCGSISFINKQANKDFNLVWNGLLTWDLTATSVYAKKNLFYPNLLNQDAIGHVSKDQMFRSMNKYFYPQVVNSDGLNRQVYTYTRPFGTLSINDKVYVLNQLASNPVAYFYHRGILAWYMLQQVPWWPWFKITGVRWQYLDIHSSNGFLINHLIPLFQSIILMSPKLLWFYLINGILLLWAVINISPLNGFHFRRERLCVLMMSGSSLLLLLGLVLVSMANDFRYHLMAVYAAEINCVLMVKIFYQRYAVVENRNRVFAESKAWFFYLAPRVKYLIIMVIVIAAIFIMTKHNKKVLFNHFNPIFLNHTQTPEEINSAYETAASQIPIVTKEFMIYKKDNFLVYKKNSCTPQDRQATFFVSVFPKRHSALYLSRIFYGYDSFEFNFKSNGLAVDQGNTCLFLTYVPQYSIEKIVTGQKNQHHQVLWQAVLH